MLKQILSVILLCSVCTQVHSWEIFGFTPETKLSDLNVIKANLDDLSEVKEYTVDAPNPNKLFDKYVIAYSIKYGVCWIKASGYHPDETYDDVTKVIRFNLVKKYGNPSEKSNKDMIWGNLYGIDDEFFNLQKIRWIGFYWSQSVWTKTFGTHRITYGIYDGECTKQSAFENRIRKNNAAIKEKLKRDAQTNKLSEKLGVSEDNF